MLKRRKKKKKKGEQKYGKLKSWEVTETSGLVSHACIIKGNCYG